MKPTLTPGVGAATETRRVKPLRDGRCEEYELQPTQFTKPRQDASWMGKSIEDQVQARAAGSTESVLASPLER